ncbi:FAD/NAD(P)-binding domain-containing protein [Lepidopterella palustris CBS 459.81]|uniref:FAD/NAD(P)-binding domain-containing protein n=1 Tax=Lepidopterella palustris CBS 459.81 TaxID=1314670 RepID=A0A8E2E361_9PEZI|nr:FAD/NAD(P)-binding domain-containing protein [Lepidopterella palustris CBS 459.81]
MRALGSKKEKPFQSISWHLLTAIFVFAKVRVKYYSYPTSSFRLENRFIDEPRKLKVAVIGAGMAGVTAGVLLPVKVPSIDLVIYEKNDDIGGTWFENIYPGVRCDIPAHVYQSTFSPNTQWSEIFAQGSEIRDYWQAVAKKYDVHRYLRLGHQVEDVAWDDSKSIWRLTIRNLKTGETLVEEKDFVLTAIGRFNAWHLPEYPGMSEYKGILRHASHWDPSFDLNGKNVAVIGNGASGIQLVANIQRSVKQLDHYARHPTWIAASWAGDERTFEPQPYSEEQKQSFEDPETYLNFRKELEDKYWRRFAVFFKGSKENAESRDRFVQTLKERISKKPELLKHLIPDFSPNCRRLTPGPGYLEAITQDNVAYITTPIKRFTEPGIETVDGVIRDVDAVFCATGANVDMAPPFSIRAHGLDLKTAWKADGEFGFPYTYLGQATPGFPNLFFVHGPHGTGPSGTVPHSVEVQLTYFAKVLRKVSREGIMTITPSRKATDDFIQYCDAFFNTTVLSENCSSWYNGGRPGSRIHGVWPGSAGHVTIVRQNPRWEDWEYEYLSDSGNRFAWYFGNGWTKKEKDPESDMTPYLKLPGAVDLRDLHESWWDLP